MGRCSEEIEASGGSGSRKAQHVSVSSREDRIGAEETMGAGAGGAEEGCLKLVESGENDSSHLQTEEEVYAACNR